MVTFGRWRLEGQELKISLSCLSEFQASLGFKNKIKQTNEKGMGKGSF